MRVVRYGRGCAGAVFSRSGSPYFYLASLHVRVMWCVCSAGLVDGGTGRLCFASSIERAQQIS